MCAINLATVIDRGELGSEEMKPLPLDSLVMLLRTSAKDAPHDARQETRQLADALVEKDHAKGIALCAWIQRVVKNWSSGPDEVQEWATWVGMARLHCKRALH